MSKADNALESVEVYRSKSDELNKKISELSAKLQEFPRNGMGLVPDDIRFSKEYQTVKREFDIAFKTLQNFNKSVPASIKKAGRKYR